jgi:hypothetical protein
MQRFEDRRHFVAGDEVFQLDFRLLAELLPHGLRQLRVQKHGRNPLEQRTLSTSSIIKRTLNG